MNNSYVYLDGNVGFLHQDFDGQSPLTSYTVSLWLRAHQLTNELQRTIKVITIKGATSVECLFTRFNTLQCLGQPQGDMSISSSGLRLLNWYIFVLRSKPSQSNLQLNELSFDTVLSQTSRSNFFPLSQNGKDQLQYQQITLGIDDDLFSEGFVGNLRNFRLFTSYMDDATLKRAQYTYINPLGDNLRVQILLRNQNDYQSITQGNSKGSIVGSIRGTQPVTTQMDYTGIFWCWDGPKNEEIQQQYLSLLKFNGQQTIKSSGITINSQTISIQAWVYRLYSTSQLSDETLLTIEDFLELKFTLQDPSSLTLTNTARTTNTLKAPFPYQRWIYIEVIAGQDSLQMKLWDDSGATIYQQQLSGRQVLVPYSLEMTIGSQFHGYMIGAKLFKDLPQKVGIHQFTSTDSTSNAYFYYLFTSDKAQTTQIPNLAREFYSVPSLQLQSGLLSFTRDIYVKLRFASDSTAQSSRGLPSSNIFDGVSCINQRVKMRFGQSNAYASRALRIETPTPVENYTVEFWFKAERAFQGEAFLFAIRNENSKVTHMVIKNEKDNFLQCFASYGTALQQSFKYIDFQSQSLGWTHVSCVYDWTNKQLKGYLSSNQVNYAYYQDLDTQANLLVKNDYKIYLNTDPAQLTRGANGIFFSELRFWRTSKSQFFIQNLRYQQLDPSFAQSLLFSYFKLQQGSLFSSQSQVPLEYDLTDLTYQTSLQFSQQITWQTQSNLLICPLGLYKGEKRTNNEVEMVCYREGIISFNVITYKTTSGGYLLSTMYSKFRNSFVRQNALEIYDFQWKMVGISGGTTTKNIEFRNQVALKGDHEELVIESDNITDGSGTYDIAIQVTDKRKQQDIQNAQIKLRPMKCANIFDLASQSSFVQIDLDSIKGQQDIVFQYGYTDCNTYKIDQSIMTFTIENDNVQLSQGDHNSKDKTYTLRTVQQTNLPLNEVFYLKIRAIWKNIQNPQDQFDYYLIYACRFVSKLVLQLSPSQTTLLKGQSLTISHSASFANINMIGKEKTYSINWICPGALQNICRNQGDQLRIGYDQFENSGLDFWKPQTIQLQAFTNFIQGDGLKYSSKSVNIVWINVNSDARIAILDSNSLSKNKNVSIEIAIPGLREDQFNIKWFITPTLSHKNCLINEDYRKQFNIDVKCLAEGIQYTASAQVLYNLNSYILWSGSVQFMIPKGPSDGTISCNPTNPKAFIEKVKCITNNWKSSLTGGVLSYQFYIRTREGMLFAVSPNSPENSITLIFPQTSAVIVKATDSRGAFSFAQTTFQVKILSSQSEINNTIQTAVKFSAFTSNIASLTLIQDLQWLLPALQQQSQVNSTFVSEQIVSLIDYINQQSQTILKSLTQLDERIFYSQGVIQASHILTNLTNVTLNVPSLLSIQAMMRRVYTREIMEYLYTQTDYQRMVMEIESNIIIAMNRLGQRGNLTYDETLFAPQEIQFKKEQAANISALLREVLVDIDFFISTKLVEGQEYHIQTNAFNFSVKKYSRINPNMTSLDYKSSNKSNALQIYFPLKTVTQPTERQSFTQILFRQNPFTGSSFLNQTATSVNAVYFAYRDINGKYLDAKNVPDQILMTFPYSYSPYIFLPNATVCGYINSGDKYWENKSCSTSYNRNEGIIKCRCNHMSFYSIIDDYLERPLKLPLIQLTFKNWSSFIAILYVFLLFIIGVIYTYNKDNQDFRYLHEQEELDGNELEEDNQLSLVSLAFKRKVFFMDFSEEFSQLSLFRLYLMLLHPIFQLKYRMDPHIPRFYRFLVLFSRINICFALAFFLLKDLQNPESTPSSVGPLVAFIFLASLLFTPLPVMIYTPFRSQYYMLKAKTNESQKVPNKILDIDGGNGAQLNYNPENDELFARLTDLEIDASIPIKLIFLINALSIEKILQASETTELYCTGNPNSVGQKLLELDPPPSEAKTDEASKNLQTTSRTIMGNPTISRDQVSEQTQRNVIRNTQNHQDFENADILISANKRNNQLTKPNDENLTPQIASEEKKFKAFGSSGNFIDEENQIAGPDEEVTASKRVLQPSKIQTRQKIDSINFEGGERETAGSVVTRTGNNEPNQREQQQQQDNNGGEEEGSEFSIDTNLFIDERKEIIEDYQLCNRFIGMLLMIALNGGIIIAVLSRFIKEGYYNEGNSYVWVLSFFCSQAFGFIVVAPVCLILQVKIVAQWLRYKKNFLAKYFRESLYIYEDYQFVVQFVKTKIS